MVDNDQAGRNGAEEAKREGLLLAADLTITNSPGMKDSEFEDLLDQDLYSSSILRIYNVDLNKGKFSLRKKKWTNRMQEAFVTSGQLWNDEVCNEVKTLIASLVEASPISAIKHQYRGPIDALVVRGPQLVVQGN